MNARLCPTEIIRIECWTGRRSMHPKPRRAPRLHWMMTTQAIPVLGKSPDIWWVNALFVLIYYIIYILYLVMDEFCSLLSLVCSWLSLQGTSPRFGDGYCGASLHVKVRSPSITEDWTCSFYTIGSVRGKTSRCPGQQWHNWMQTQTARCMDCGTPTCHLSLRNWLWWF